MTVQDGLVSSGRWVPMGVENLCFVSENQECSLGELFLAFRSRGSVETHSITMVPRDARDRA